MPIPRHSALPHANPHSPELTTLTRQLPPTRVAARAFSIMGSAPVPGTDTRAGDHT